MANQSKLKAWVRYDGTGRVISGGPIFQVNKPKVGNWRQIDANLCCNGNTPTTTTTTTNGGGVTPTAFIQSYWTSVAESCDTSPFGDLLFYSASSTIQEGITVFSDASLTTPILFGHVIIHDNIKYTVGEGGVLIQIDCFGSFYFGNTSEVACSTAPPAMFLQIAVDDQSLTPGTTIYSQFTQAGFSIGQYIYLYIQPGYPATVLVEVTSATTAIVIGEPVPCEPISYTYYETNQYFCDDCSTVQGTGVVIKVSNFNSMSQSIYFGSWINDTNSPTVQYNILAIAAPNIFAADVNPSSVSNQCTSCAV